jgi:phosphatidylethanolamine/phosphatidyl-N-methylethanolamine N-methyltransferase
MFKDLHVFFREFRQTFKTTGAIAPSSPRLAKAITYPLTRRPLKPIHVLEVGPGTGSFTQEILRLLRPGDRLDLYELNPRFHRYLQEKLPWEGYAAKGIHCRLHNTDVRKVAKVMQFDYIVCGLPFNNFDPELVTDILNVLTDRLSPEGVFSYFEYIFSHRFKAKFLRQPSERERMLRVGITVRRFVQEHQFACRQVWFNIPPAKARYCRKTPRRRQV